MKLRGNRETERAGVNAARSFFEANGCVFQEVELGNDYGKDAYVDITKERAITGGCIGLQIKSGTSYRKPDGYGIPLDKAHEDVWRGSSIALAGIVHDPDDGLLRWCNISHYLAENRKKPGSYIPVPKDQTLTPESLQGAFASSFRRVWDEKSVGSAVLGLCGEGDVKLQEQRVADFFAVGRYDPRAFIALRYLLRMLNGRPLEIAIFVLGHLTPHPDICWGKHNWIDDAVVKEVQKHFRFDIDELCHLLRETKWDSWFRGGVGESLYMIISEDANDPEKMRKTAVRLLEEGSLEAAFSALYVGLYWSGKDAKSNYEKWVAEEPRLRSLPMIVELEDILGQQTFVTLFE